MATIDDKVVAMSFESSKFESGVNKTISSLDRLKAALHFPNAGKGLSDIDAAAKRVDLGHIGKAVDDIKSKFGALSVAALAVLSSIAIKAVHAGAQIVKGFTLEPLKAGFAEYSTNLNAVQTILANTQAAGVGIKEVNATLRELNEYSDRTIYNFSQMAKNIGTFTAAGVDLETATGSIKGIANLAALSGSNAEQASTAMYQLSQAISSGAVKLQDWNSVVNAGMGGTVFQRALAQTAEAVGTLDKGTVKLTGKMKNVSIAGESFRQSLSKPGKDSWLTSDVLTKTLEQFTSDLSDADLKAQGFNATQIKAIQATAKTAMHAATEVKTITQALDVAKETAASGWAQTWQIIFGDFAEAKKTFTSLSETINGFINKNAEARNKVLGDWKALGGRALLIDSIKVAFHNLSEAIAPIKEAFREIFPAKTGKDLMNLTVTFANFVAGLRPSVETVENLKRTFKGLFSVLDIVKEVIFGVVGVIGDLIGATGAGGGGFLSFTANVGDALVAFREWLIEGGRLASFFDKLTGVLKAPINLLKALGKALGDLFSGFSPGGFSDQIGGITNAMTPLQKVMEGVTNVWNSFLDAVGNSGNVLKPVVDAIIQLITGLGSAIGDAAANMNFDAILQVIQTGLFAGVFLMFKKFLGKGSLLEQLGGKGGILGNVSGMFDALRGSMVAMQQNIKADTLQKIAIAIGILAASIVALSFVDPERLKSSLTAMTVAFGQLLGAMAILGNISKSLGFIKMPVIAASMILLAGAIVVLSAAVVILSRLSWEELAKGLGGVAVLLGVVSAAVIPLSANSAGMIRAGIGIAAIAASLLILAAAVKILGSMDLASLGKGLGGVAAGLILMVFAMQKMPVVPLKSTVGLMAMAAALVILATAVRIMGSMDLASLGKGLGGMAAGLILMVFAMQKMPAASMAKNAFALLLMATAIRVMADAIAKMGEMSFEQMGKGLFTLGAALLFLGIALNAMSGSLAGAIALGIAAAGITLLAGALQKMGSMSPGEIIKSLILLAAALTVIGIAGALITPVIPSLLGFGLALLAIGAGLALAGAGIFLIGAGLSALVVAAPTGVGVLIAAFVELQEGIIKNIKLLILGVLEIVQAIADTAPQFVDALVKILDSLLDVIIKASPKIVEAFNAILAAALQILRDNQGKIIQAGFNLLVALLQGIKNNIPQLVTLVADIVARFLSGIANNLGKIITAGTSILISLLKGIASHITSVATTVADIIVRFLNAIASNLGRIATAGLSILTRLLKAIADRLGDVIDAGVDVIVAFVKGIGKAGERIVTAARESAGKFIKTLASEIVNLADDVFTAMINLINGLADVVEARAPELRGAAVHLGVAIIQGMTSGLTGAAGDLYAKAKGIADKALSIIKRPWSVLSPSKTMAELGKNIIAGMTLGLDKNATNVYSSAAAVSNGVIKSFNDTLQIKSPSKVMIEIGKAVGQGFAQGIRGSAEDIKGAFAELNEKLTDQMATSREIIAKEQEKLEELRKAKKPDPKEIKETQAVIKENQDLLARSTAGHILLTKALKDEKKELISLANDYEKIGTKLEEAKTALADLRQQRVDYQQSLVDQYAAAPDISGTMVEEIASARGAIAQEQAKLNEELAKSEQDPEQIAAAQASVISAQLAFDKMIAGKTLNAEGTAVDQLATYTNALKNQADAVSAYQSTLDQLRKLGLDDVTYQKLLKEGPQDQAFANQLLAGGKTAVKSLNTLDSNLMKVSKTLATNAATNLYKAGIKAAKGLVAGLASQSQEIEDQMTKLANEMIAALKAKLKIKSPSQAFAEIGVLSMEGMAKGFSTGTKIVTDAVDLAAQDALSAMKKSMRDISDVVTDELNPNPVITPILDLTQIRAQAGELGALTTVVPITAAASYNQAAIISSQRTAAQMDESAIVPVGASVKFEQNNYSPEALTEIEIYRQTKNQLSQLKSVLALT